MSVKIRDLPQKIACILRMRLARKTLFLSCPAVFAAELGKMKAFITFTMTRLAVACVVGGLSLGFGLAEAKSAIIPEGKPYALREQGMRKPNMFSKKSPSRAKKSDADPVTAGWVEKICIGDSDNPVKAKLDTGAAVSSVDAEIIKYYKKNGKKYILYRINFGEGVTETFKSKVTRHTRIKSRAGEKSIRRPVVMMKFKIGKYELYEEVNLADREGFVYPVLIGRNMLEGNIIVDSSETFKLKTSCKLSDAE